MPLRSNNRANSGTNSCTSDTTYFDKLFQQVGGFSFTTEGTSITDIRVTSDKLSMDQQHHNNRALTPSSEDGSKSPLDGDNSGNINNSKRKYHNKSRNGCATCKKRRVKCDERHPICSKCEHMKIECVYLPVEPKVRRKKKEILAERARQNSNSSNVMHRQEVKAMSNLMEFLQQRQQQQQSPQDQQSIPSINVNDYDDDTTSTNYTSSAISERGNSIHSFTSSQSSPLSDNGIKQELNHHNHHHLSLSGIPPHFAHHSPQSPQLSQQLHRHQQLHMSQNRHLQQLLQHHLMVKSHDPQANVENTLMTPLQIQMKIQRAQEYQKERVKQFQEYATKSEPNLTPSVSSPSLVPSPLNSYTYSGSLNILDLRLMYHYTTKVWPTITAAGISEERIWSEDIPKLAFSYPFLMHSILAFSATHLSRTERGLDQCVTCHRGDALKLLREAVLEISPANTDALVASALILIMDSLANASLPTSSSPKSLPASAWVFHVKGAATILTAVWPLNESSRFYKFIGVDLGDLGDIINSNSKKNGEVDSIDNLPQDERSQYSDLECFDLEIADLYPVRYDSPYLITLAYLNKLNSERYKSDFILRIFAFPALLDKSFLGLLITGDISAMRIMRCYYSLLRSFTTEMKDRVWFLEGVSNVLPVDVEQYSGGGGMNMMMDFLGGPATLDMGGDDDLESYSEVGNGLLNPDNLPSSITNTMDVMQGDNDFI